MTLTPRLRKLMLTAHVTASVGWLGAVAGFLALAVAGVASDDVQTVRAAYLAMETVGWSVLVPLSIASLVTGLVQALGTTWGLVRYYWVLIKFLLTIVATTVLLLYMSTLGDLAANGGQVAGKVIWEVGTTKGDYYVIYDPSDPGDDRGVWKVTI
jgi:hypothetical protein